MEATYQHCLLAVDLTDNVDRLVHKAVRIAKQNNASISLIHVVEVTPAVEHIFVDRMEYEKQVRDEVESRLIACGVNKEIPSLKHLVQFGSPKMEILSVAEKLQCDLIILGSHERHGIRHFLGSTANAVGNAANCDVLIVRFSHNS